MTDMNNNTNLHKEYVTITTPDGKVNEYTEYQLRLEALHEAMNEFVKALVAVGYLREGVFDGNEITLSPSTGMDGEAMLILCLGVPHEPKPKRSKRTKGFKK